MREKLGIIYSCYFVTFLVHKKNKVIYCEVDILGDFVKIIELVWLVFDVFPD